MSYILNALRKSEQERQANQPETVTGQVLIPPPQKNRKMAVLIGGLLAVNLVAVSLAVWYLKNSDNTPAKTHPAVQSMRNKAAQKPLPAAQNIVHAADSAQEAEGAKQQLPLATAPAAKTPTIEDLAMSQQPAGEEKAAKSIPEDKKLSSELGGQREQLKKTTQTKHDQRPLTAESVDNPEGETDKSEEQMTNDATSAKEIPLFKDLPYDFRSSAPKMTINVFMYDDDPDDRFIVLNMTKYKAGQTTKDSIEIKEIRPDSVVVSYGGRVFRIERP
jgi:general secretion pathway protein B